MRTNKGTIIVEGTFNVGYEEYFKEYSSKIQAFLKQFQTTIIRRQLINETLYGQDKPNLIMLIDFEDKEVARKIFFEEEYISIIPLRDKIFKTFKMYLADFDNV
jgi:uncharacterized protein (DUF1330 family)